MSTDSLVHAPTSLSERIKALDIMRGIVLCGILLMNINDFGLAEAYSDPTVSGGADGFNLYTWIATNMFFEGTMRGLFSLLFGVGMYVLLDRLVKRDGSIKIADIYFRRLMWLMFFGIVHGYILLWHGEILFDYALMGFLVYSFRSLPAKKLVMISAFLIFCGFIWNYADYKSNTRMFEQAQKAIQYKAEGKELDFEMKEADKKWTEIQERRSPESINFTNETMRKGYFDVLPFNASINMAWEKYANYRYGLWDILSMMLLGIALFKWNVLAGQRTYRFYTIMMLAGYAVGLSVNYYETTLILDHNFDYLSFQKASITYDIGRVSTAMGHIGLIMLFCKMPWMHWLKSALAATGRMALTNYLMHSVICMIVFTGVGFGLFGKLQRYELLYVVFGIWILQLIVSPIWLRYFYFGPVEWLWRRLSYLNHPPFFKYNKPIIAD